MRTRPTRIVYATAAAAAAALLSIPTQGCFDKHPECPAAHVLGGDALPSTMLGTEHFNVDGDEVWRASGSPHLVMQNIAVSEGATLTIEACAVVVMKDETVGIQAGSGWGLEGTAGDLVAVGTEQKPILFTGETKSAGSWDSLRFEHMLGESRISHAVIEYGGTSESEFEAAVWGGGHDGEASNVVTIDNVNIRDSGSNGIRFERHMEFSIASGDITIERAAWFPIETDQVGVRSIPEGTYTGNGDDRFKVAARGALVEGVGTITWRKLSLSYFLDQTSYQRYHVKVVFEPGVHVSVGGADLDNYTILIFHDGGSLEADGGSEDGRIVFEGERTDISPSWAGFAFESDEHTGTHAGQSVMNYVTIRDAGLLDPGVNDAGSCTDTIDRCTAVQVEGDFLTMTNTEIVGTTPECYAVNRDWCGDGSAQYSAAGTGNVFSGEWHCAESDQFPCQTATGACLPDMSCCDHEYVCHG